MNKVCPEKWKAERVILINEPKIDPKKPEANRQISFPQTWGKVLDKLLSRRLVYHLESHHIQHDQQFGFRVSRGADEARKLAIDFISDAKSKGKHAILITLD